MEGQQSWHPAGVKTDTCTKMGADAGALGHPSRRRPLSTLGPPTDLARPLQQLLVGGGGAHQRVGGVQRGGGVAAAAAKAGA